MIIIIIIMSTIIYVHLTVNLLFKTMKLLLLLLLLKTLFLK